jgi:hypothetical protein
MIQEIEISVLLVKRGLGVCYAGFTCITYPIYHPY